MYEQQLMHKKVQSRKAIAMLELIFAIVIIGITLLSVPNLIYQASESGYTTIQQESIAAAASDLSLILSREWDENGTSDEYHTPILTTTSATSTLSTRPGAQSRSFFTGIGGPFPANAIGSDTDDLDFDDIDDGDGVPGQLHLIDGTQDLIDIDITISTDVDYIADATNAGTWNASPAITFNFSPTAAGSPTNTTNIKKVSITLTSNSSVEELSDKEITFNAFSSNIGSYKLERRVLP